MRALSLKGEGWRFCVKGQLFGVCLRAGLRAALRGACPLLSVNSSCLCLSSCGVHVRGLTLRHVQYLSGRVWYGKLGYYVPNRAVAPASPLICEGGGPKPVRVYAQS